MIGIIFFLNQRMRQRNSRQQALTVSGCGPSHVVRISTTKIITKGMLKHGHVSAEILSFAQAGYSVSGEYFLKILKH